MFMNQIYWSLYVAYIVWQTASACKDRERDWSPGKPTHAIICAIRVACGGIRVPFLQTIGWRLTAMGSGPTDGVNSMEKDESSSWTTHLYYICIFLSSIEFTIVALGVKVLIVPVWKKLEVLGRKYESSVEHKRLRGIKDG